MRPRFTFGSALLGFLLAASCTVQDQGTGGRAGGAGGAAAGSTSGSPMDVASSSSTSSTSSTSTGTQGGPAPEPLYKLVGYPNLDKPWRGAVLVRPSGQVGSWSLDGSPLPPPTPKDPSLLLDTLKFADGEHTLSLEALKGGSVKLFSGKVSFDNGPPGGPPLQGTFTDIAGTIAIPQPSVPAGKNHPGAIAGDLDGDGDLDLVAWMPFLGQVQIYLQTGPLSFTPTGAPIFFTVASAGLGDLDGDGLPELVLGGGELRVFKNIGGSFNDVTAQTGLVQPPGVPRDYQGITMVDLDDDGLLDILVAHLHCSGDTAPNLALRNEGGLRFADVAPELGLVLAETRTFAFAADRVGKDGVLHLWPYHDACKNGPMTKHYRFGPGPDLPVLLDVTEPKDNLGPMGSAVLDTDGDGLLDEYVSGCFNNPVWNGPEYSATISPFVGLDAFPDPDGHFIAAWSMATLDANLDGLPDIYVTHHPSGPSGNIEGSRDAFFWQKAPGHFREIAGSVGLTGFQPCRSVQAADLDSDGDADLLIGCASSIRVLRNDLVDPTPGRTVMLHGSISNRDGVNAQITSPSGEPRLVRGGGNPYAGGVAQETLRAPSGTITVTWPSGIVQQVDAGTGPVLDIFEPKVVSVFPRRVLASGPSPVQIVVRPAELGDPAAAVAVSASLGVFTTPMHQDPDGIWRGELAPPSAVATVVLEVTVGAQKLKVRPRVFVR